jgi:UMF1 family MFS transporter
MDSDQKRRIFGWAMYDWANSAYILSVGTALLPAYFAAAVVPKSGLPVLGTTLSATSLWGYMVSLSAALIFLCGPVLGAVADFSGSRKRFLILFSLLGSCAVVGLGLCPPGLVWPLVLLFVIAHFSFAGANIFYDAFLPHIARPGQEDRISGKGFAYGYFGGGVHLALCLAFIARHDWFGLSEAGAVRTAMASAGVWWFGFALVTFRLLPETIRPQTGPERKPGPAALIRIGLSRVRKTLKKAPRNKSTFLFLIGFMIYNDGVQTVISMATIYGKEELGLETPFLILTLLAIQFVAVPGALIFGRLGQRITARRALILSLVIWSGVALYAYFITTTGEYLILGILVGMVLGGTQSLSRSLYATLIPRENAAEYYGFYSVFAKLSVIWGPLLFAAINQLTGSSRPAVLFIITFFVTGLTLLILVGRYEEKDSLP